MNATIRINESMAYRAVTQRDAEYIGNAASVVGGFVAVYGARLVASELRDEDSGGKVGGWAVDFAEHYLQKARDDGKCIDPLAARRHLMVVPNNSPLSDMGVAVPREMVERWVAHTQSWLACTYVEEERHSLPLYLSKIVVEN